MFKKERRKWDFLREMIGGKMSGTGVSEQSSCQAHWFLSRRLYEHRRYGRVDKIIDSKIILLGRGGCWGIFQILLILSKNAFRGWADGEAFTEARRHGGVRYVNHEFFE